MKIGLVLGGGAGLGWAHIGAFRVLEHAGIHIDVVAGTSIGSIVGASIAAGKLDDLEEIARDITIKEILMMGEFSFKKGSILGAGKIEKEMRRHFGNHTIESLDIPFAAIAADVYTGERVVMDQGDVVTAIRASSAVPGVLPPVDTNRMMLIDGGVVDPVPVEAARELGADFIIAVDLQADFQGRVKSMGFDPLQEKPRAAAMKTARAGLYLTLSTLGRIRSEAAKADVIIEPKIGHIEASDFTKANELIALGAQAMDEVLPEIEILLEQRSIKL
ncbi:patatin-like phospholipase family protein [Kordiimonas sp. SCSIO 12610]|uniref:patatin-like phospholipase family protein n=1 Tax=Kordiimonas sp. SCSIO 12610 TaxID=2829597 RepID=UPI00210C7331|nr:patatin-like phospholipase family protein [Kordiimonas sp. SCSIO 12610]UTW53823.1 patatin-like phospholipase family protein [Kordiimonas sp. SCSIO 12610]